MLQSINELVELTGRNARTISNHLIDLQYKVGPKGAHLYESTEALPLIYAVDNLEEARAERERSQAVLNRIRAETLRKERIPIDLVRFTFDQVYQAFAAALKACKKLNTEDVNGLLDKFRDIPRKLGWGRR